MITIPENGATLTFLRSVRSANANTVSYSVKVGEGTDPSTFTTVFTEDEEPISYKPVTIDLKEFAGKMSILRSTPMHSQRADCCRLTMSRLLQVHQRESVTPYLTHSAKIPYVIQLTAKRPTRTARASSSRNQSTKTDIM